MADLNDLIFGMAKADQKGTYIVGQAFLIVRLLQTKRDLTWRHPIMRMQTNKMLKEDLESFERMEARYAAEAEERVKA